MSPRLPQRGELRRAIVILPNGFTLANLFFGIFAIVSAARGQFSAAGWYVVLGGIADAFDGRVARATKTGTRFGEELDSLVDAISFGLAPGLIMYFAVLNREGWAWLLVFVFAAAAVMRLARFNVEQAGRKKLFFHGLPSPAAGMTLATYYWFSQTPLYNHNAIAGLPWHSLIPWLMLTLSFLMISSVPYPAVPTIGFRSARGLVGLLVVVVAVLAMLVDPKQFLFPLLVSYVAYGVLTAAITGLLDRIPTGDMLLEEEEEEGEADTQLEPDGPEPADAEPAGATSRRRRRKRRRGGRPTPNFNPAVEEGGARD